MRIRSRHSAFHAALSTVAGIAALLLLTVRAGAADAGPAAAGVHDNARIFSLDAVGKADDAIGQIRDRHHLDLRIETYARLPDEQRAAFDRQGKARFFAGWAASQARDGGVNGVLILICMGPGHVEVVDAGPGAAKAFTDKDRDELSPALGKVLGEKQYDDALSRAVAFVAKRMDANDPVRAAEAPKPAPVEHAAQGGTAVVDMDKVARMVGWQEAMATQSKAAEKDLLDELNIYQTQLARTLGDREKALAVEAHFSIEQTAQLEHSQTLDDLQRIPLSPGEREELVRNIQEINRARQAAQNQSREAFERYQTSLLESYRDEIKPAVSRVAFDEGYTLVTVTQPSLVYVDPSVEITEKVAKVLQKNMPEPKPPGKPALDLPPFKLSPLTAPASAPTTSKTGE